MPQKNIILNSLKESFLLILKNKSIFIFLLALQVVFFVIFSMLSQMYLPKIMESAKAMSDYFQNLDEVVVTEKIINQQDILGDDALELGRNFESILANFRIYFFYVFISLIFFMSISWLLTHKIVHKGKMNMVKDLLRIFVVLFIYLSLIFMFFYSLLNIPVSETVAQTSYLSFKYSLFLFACAVLSYFMFISLALVSKTNLKDIVQKTLSVGIRKIHYVLVVYLIVIAPIFLSMFLLVYFTEISIIIILLSMILFVFSFVFGRIFIANAVDKLSEMS